LTTNVSRAAVERYIRVGAAPKNKIRFMPNGIDTTKFKPNKAAGQRLRNELGVVNYFVWLAVGRFDIQKDYPNLLHALYKVAEKFNDALLLIVGDGPLRPDMEELTRTLGIDKQVRFLGICHNIPDLMNAADAYVMSSAWEGMPMVLLEAGACGLPIVATDVGGNSEVVLNGKTGFIVPPSNPEAIAQAMEKMMALSKEKRLEMGEAGRAYIEANYSLEHVVDQWETLYMELLQRKGMLD